MIESEWIKLLVKFNGTCQICEKQILVGEYALWSKSSKKIKHIDCPNNNNNNIHSKPIEKDSSLILSCLLCGAHVQNVYSDNSFHHLESQRQTNSIFLCKDCLQNPNSYLKYQGLFYEKIKKIVKLKS
jgi:hypothetical protein